MKLRNVVSFSYTNILSSQRGGGMIIVLLILSMAMIVYLFGVAERTLQLEKIGRMKQKQLTNSQLQKELEVVFSHSEFCTSLLTISPGNNFTLGRLAPNATTLTSGSSKATIIDMKILNVVNLPGGMKSGNFTITSSPGANMTIGLRRLSVPVQYLEVGDGTVSQCQLVVDPQEACERLGATWDTVNSRCQICEDLGGTWSAGSCEIG